MKEVRKYRREAERKWKREDIELICTLKYQPKMSQAKRQLIDSHPCGN